ncbi:hypothetical protein AB0D94_13740 [Streptomyces sp. NPDC048255]
MNITRIFQAAAVVALTLVVGTPAVASAASLPAAKPPVAAADDMSWQ